jgi:hypothetical protein
VLRVRAVPLLLYPASQLVLMGVCRRKSAANSSIRRLVLDPLFICNPRSSAQIRGKSSCLSSVLIRRFYQCSSVVWFSVAGSKKSGAMTAPESFSVKPRSLLDVQCNVVDHE